MWRNGDRIAVERHDVAGVMRKRPALPPKIRQTVAQLGHPNGRGLASSANGRRGEYLGDGSSPSEKQQSSSSVGRGQNKWVERKEYEPWNGGTTSKGANRK